MWWVLLQDKQNLILELCRNFYSSLLQALYPLVDLFALHGVEHASELLNLLFGILLRAASFVGIKFLVIEVERFLVETLLAYSMPSAAAALDIVVLLGLRFAFSAGIVKQVGYNYYCK